MNDHIIHEFDDALRVLREELIGMADCTIQNLERAVRSLLQRDTDLSRLVIADDTLVDDAEKEIDRLGMELMTRFRPLASDLRMVIATMKASINLERISDHAVNIAKRARKMNRRPALPEVHRIEPLYEAANQMLRDCLSAFIDRDEKLAKGLHARDKELDRQHKQLAAEFASRLEEGEGRSEDYLHLILVARSLERVGDLSVNIGEDAVFLESAEDIRYTGKKHKSAKGAEPGSAGEEPAGEATDEPARGGD